MSEELATYQAKEVSGGHPDRLPDLDQQEIADVLHKLRQIKGERADLGRVYKDERNGRVCMRVYNEA